jgi:divalent metal cation (Fe/Co/Zn/Cd) transporter
VTTTYARPGRLPPVTATPIAALDHQPAADCGPFCIRYQATRGTVWGVSVVSPIERRLLRQGLLLEYATLTWNVAGTAVLCVAAVGARSVALAGFGVDSLIEILASTVVVWQLQGAGDAARERRALRIIAVAFVLLAAYIAVQTGVTLRSRSHPGHSPLGIGWLALTVVAMLVLATGKYNIGKRLGSVLLRLEARVTVIDGALAAAVLVGVVLNTTAGWWWADPVSALVILAYGLREATHAWAEAASV